jgi:hypothetical protein
MDVCKRHPWSAPGSIAIAVALTATVSAQPAAPTATNLSGPTVRTAADVVAGMQGFSTDLKSYEVPLTLRGGVRVTFITIPFEAYGMEYYDDPNRQAVHLCGRAGFGVATQQNNGHLAYNWVGPPKKSGSRIKSVPMWVAAKTFALQTVSFLYQNGS